MRNRYTGRHANREKRRQVNWFEELKKRGVVRVGIAYVVTAWLLVQVADTIFPAFSISDWVMRGLIILLAAGLPVTLVISWIWDLTSKGWVRAGEYTEDSATRAHRNLVLNFAIMAVLAAAVIVFALDKFVWTSAWVESEMEAPEVVAVLPFSDFSRGETSDTLAVGIHDDLLTQLSKIPSFRTLSRTSVLRYADTRLPIPEIAREVGATGVVEGGVQRSAGRVRINAQFIDARTDTHLWAETYDRELTAENIFAIQSDIARSIADALQATLSPELQDSLDSIPTRSLEAYDAYAAGRAAMRSLDSSSIQAAVDAFEKATSLDPEFASAWAGLCQAQLARFRRDSDRQLFDAAEAACSRALEIDDRRAEVHLALGSLYRQFGQYARAEVALQRANYAKAEQALERALSLEGLRIESMIEMGKVLAQQGRLPEAEATLKQAQAQAPNDFAVQSALFGFYYRNSDLDDRFDRAVQHAREAANLRPDLAIAWNNLGTSLYMTNQYDAAADAWKHSLEIEPTRTAYTNTGLALYNAGRYAEAVAMQERATTLAPDDHRAWGRLGDAQRHLGGDQDAGMAAYRRAVDLARGQLEINPRDWRTRSMLAFYLACLGDEAAAVDASRRALQDSDRRAEVLFYSALVNLLFDRRDEALALLAEAVDKDEEFRHLIASDPDMGVLRDDDRFRSLTAPVTG